MIRTNTFLTNFVLCAFLALGVSAQEKKPITLYWSDARNDLFTSASEAGDRNAKAAGYVVNDAKTQGFIYKTQQPGTVPLTTYYSEKLTDCLTVTTSLESELEAKDGYQAYEMLGYIHSEKNLAAPVPLVLYQNSKTSDTLTTTTPLDLLKIENRSDYVLFKVLGYVDCVVSVNDLKKNGGKLHYEGPWDFSFANTSSIEVDPSKSQVKYYYQFGDAEPFVATLPCTFVDNAQGRAELKFTLPDGNRAQFVWISYDTVVGDFRQKGRPDTEAPLARTEMDRVNALSTSDQKVASTGVLAVPSYAQQTTMWCWATSGEMIMKFHGVSISQCKQANDYYKKERGKEFTDRNIDCCGFLKTEKKKPDPAIVEGGYPQFKDYGFTFNTTTDILSFEDIKGQIDKKQPIGFTWYWKAASGIPGGGHYMVLSGYKTVAGIQMVKINDPWPNNVAKETPDKHHSRWMTYKYWRDSSKHRHGQDDYDIIKKPTETTKATTAIQP